MRNRPLKRVVDVVAVCVMSVSLGARGASAQSFQWQLLRSDLGGFEVEVPGRATEEAVRVPLRSGDAEGILYRVKIGDVVFAARFDDFPGGRSRGFLEAQSDHQVLDRPVLGALLEAYEGIESRGPGPSGTIQRRLAYSVGARLFQLLVFYPNEGSERAFGFATERMFKSFRLVPRSLGAIPRTTHPSEPPAKELAAPPPIYKSIFTPRTQQRGNAPLGPAESALADVREIARAQASFKQLSANTHRLSAEPGCLAQPAVCLPGAPTNSLLSRPALTANPLGEHGYRRLFHAGERVTIRVGNGQFVGLAVWAYTADPTSRDNTKAFCTDVTGLVFEKEDGSAFEVKDGLCARPARIVP